MILKEATIGGTIYVDWLEDETKLPEAERIAFDYGPLSNRVKIDLLHNSRSATGFPNGADVCKAAIDGTGRKVKNITTPTGEKLDTIEKLLAYNGEGNSIAYMIEIAGCEIWKRQAGEVGLKN